MSVIAQRIPAFDIINHFLPLWAPLVILLSFFLARSGFRAGALPRLAGLALLGAALFVPGRAAAPEFLALAAAPRNHAPPSLRLVSFNFKKDNPHPEEAAAWLANADADIVVLLEAPPPQSPASLKLLAAYPYQIDCRLSGGRCSTQILSKTPPLKKEALGRGDPNNRKGLSAAKGEFCISNTKISVIAAHLSRPWPRGVQQRDMRELIFHVKNNPPETLVVAGDFNLTPWSYALRSLDRAFEINRVTRASPTWPANHAPAPALLPLDHIYAGSAINGLSVLRGPANGSDHRPVIADFAIKAGGAGAC